MYTVCAHLAHNLINIYWSGKFFEEKLLGQKRANVQNCYTVDTYPWFLMPCYMPKILSYCVLD